MNHEASCLACGARFSFSPSNSNGKYCSARCCIEHRRSVSAFAGMGWRKLLLRVAAHSETSALRVWAIVRELDVSIKSVIIRDMMQEREYVMAEITRIYTAMTESERKDVRAEMLRLEARTRMERAVKVTVTCAVCGTANMEAAGACHSCGNGIIAELGMGFKR